MASTDIRTLNFIEASDYLKNELSIKVLEQANIVGITKSQIEMVRARRRKIQPIEVSKLIKAYPEVSGFFSNTSNKESSINYFERVLASKDEVIVNLKEDNQRLRNENIRLTKTVDRLEQKADRLMNKIIERFEKDQEEN